MNCTVPKSDMKVAVIGAGNMGSAMARGWARAFGGVSVIVSNPSTCKLDALRDEFPDISVTTDNADAARSADIVVIAVKPWKMQEVIGGMRDVLANRCKTVVSVAAGVEPDEIERMIGGDEMPAIIYAIPNTAVSTGHGMIFYTASASTDAGRCEAVAQLFAPLGVSRKVELRQMSAGMAVASCGIAYAMRYIRAAVEGGVELGLRPEEAQIAVMQTLAGAVALLDANGTHPEQEVDKVTTPGGITIRGLNAMEEAGFTASVIRGLRASR